MKKFLFMIIFALAMTQSVFATAQEGNVIFIDGEEWMLLGEPIMADSVLFQRMKAVLPKDRSWTTANWDGYTSYWSLKQGLLYLDKITVKFFNNETKETLQEEMIYEDRRIRLDAIQETLVPLVSPKLAVAEIVTGHQDRIQVHRLPQDIHPGMERNLPLAVHHGRRNTDPELDIHLSAPLCLVTETGGYDGGIQHVRCYHLPRCLIFHRLEENKVASVFAFDEDCVGMLETNTGNLVR